MAILSLNSNIKVVVLVESRQQLDFFLRFKEGFKELNIKFLVITDKPSIYLESRFLRKVTTYLIKPVEREMAVPDLSMTVEVCAQTLSVTQARSLYISVFVCASKIFSAEQQIIYFVWSGYSTASLAVRDVAKTYNASILYFDRGNYHGKYFVDPQGTNQQSYLYKNLQILDDISVRDLNNQRTADTDKSLQDYPLKKISAHINYYFIVDLMYPCLGGLPFRGERNIFKKYIMKLRPYYSKYTDHYHIIGSKYCFVALPHSYELKKQRCTLKSFSEIISKILSDAKKNKIDTVVKFHPDEDDKIFIDTLIAQKKYGSLFVVTSNIHELIHNAQEVFLFNSSVALEAIIQNKIHHFVQSSLFEQFTSKRAVSYLNNYLITPDYDRYGYFKVQTVQKILGRLTI